MITLARDMDGHRVLDAGCGSGPLVRRAAREGALVSGFDASRAMIELARQRPGAEADLQVADIGRPPPFEDDVSR